MADVAFALAVNSITHSVAVQWSLNLFRPAVLGDRVIADCSTIHRGRRLLVVDLEVHSRLTTVFSLITCARNRSRSSTSVGKAKSD